MQRIRIMVGLLVAVVCSMAVAVAPASAATVEECQASLSELRQETLDATDSFTSARDVGGLVAKLDNAAAKLAEGKNADAVDKLVGYQSTLSSLATAPKPKVEATTADTLSTGAQAVIDCVVALG